MAYDCLPDAFCTHCIYIYTWLNKGVLNKPTWLNKGGGKHVYFLFPLIENAAVGAYARLPIGQFKDMNKHWQYYKMLVYKFNLSK